MKGFAKGLTLCLLLLSLLATTVSAASFDNCPGECTHQASIGTTHYDTLQEAVAAADAGATVTLLADVTTAPLEITKSLTLNLGGKTLTGAPADHQALLTFTSGGALRNGKISVTSGSVLKVSDCVVAMDKDVRLEGCGTVSALLVTAGKEAVARVNISGEISAKEPLNPEEAAPLIDAMSEEGSCEVYILKNAKLTARKNLILTMDCAGKLDISDGTLSSQKDMFRVAVAEKRKLELSITGGKLLSTEGNVITFTKKDDKAVIPGNFVTGGTYHKVPTAYVPGYCVIRDNQDTTYTVIAAYTLTFQADGGTGTMNAVPVRCGSSYTLPDCGFSAPQGKDFLGWEIDGVKYAPGSSYTPSGNTTVKALWTEHVHTGGKATCKSKAVCSSCGESYGMKGSHSLYSVGAYAPSCSADGMNAHKRCSTCGQRFVNGEVVSLYDLSMPALGHLWQSEVGKPADCQNEGILDHESCANCGQLRAEGVVITRDDLVIPAGGHALESVEKTDATCTQAGTLAHEHCTVCGLLLVDNKPVEAAQLTTGTTSHVLSDWFSDETGHWKSCVDCGKEFRRGSHKMSADGCTDCGFALTSSEKAPDAREETSFSWLFLIPVIAAVGIAGFLAVTMLLKSRK